MQGGKSILMMQTSCRAYLTFIGRAQEEIDLCSSYAPVCGGKKGNEYKGRRPEKSCCSFEFCPNAGGGALPFSQVHFWSINGVYFLQNANNLNFKLEAKPMTPGRLLGPP